MRNNLKRVISLLLCLAICAGAATALAVNAFAEDAGAELKRGTFKFAPHTVLNLDLEDYYYYSDDFFSGSAFEYNEHLATLSMITAAASISSQDVDATYEDMSRNLNSLMRELDFWGFEVNNYYMQEPGEQTMGVAMAYRIIGEGEDACTVLAIIPRSAGYKKEWAGNFTVGTEGEHEGFAAGKKIILEFAKRYVEAYGEAFEGDVKIWTMGYSRGAGVSNLVAAALVDNCKEEIGLDVKQENIFAYTFGTPSTIQYANEAEKATIENNYANIWNVYADYDIVTFAPFKNWNFTYYGKTRNIDAYNAEKKAKMLEFLKGTNETIYNIYTAENSAADPDNFAAVKVELKDGAPNFIPADASYGIPTSQKEFLESRIAFLVEKLVPDRETYVNEGYQYALQRVTSLYFGLDNEGGTELFGGMSEKAMILAAIYYAYFLTDCHLTEENVDTLAAALGGTIETLEAYISATIEGYPTFEYSEWFEVLSATLESEEYKTMKQYLISSNAEALKSYVPTIRTTIENLAISITSEVLGDGVEALSMEDEDEQKALYETMTAEAVARPLAKFIVYLLLGTDDTSMLEAFNIGNKNIALAATFIYNSGRYMRVHNNEIILSWLRSEDSYYLEQPHVHSFTYFANETHHGFACECGEIQEQSEHKFGEWTVVDEPTKTTEGVKKQMCACGYAHYENVPVVESNLAKIIIIIVASVGGALVVAGGVTAIVIVKKRKKQSV